MNVELNFGVDYAILVISASVSGIVAAVAGVSAAVIHARARFVEEDVLTGSIRELRAKHGVSQFANLLKGETAPGIYAAVTGPITSTEGLVVEGTSQRQVVRRRRVVEHYHDHRRRVSTRASTRDISDIVSTVPCAISEAGYWTAITGKRAVALADLPAAVRGNRVDLTPLADRFEPADPSTLAHIASAVGGTTITKGYQHIEEGLAVGATVTAIGYLTIQDGQMTLGNGPSFSLHITQQSLSDFIASLHSEASTASFIAWSCAIISISCALVALAMHPWRPWRRRPANDPEDTRLGEDLLQRRAAQGQAELMETCVICLDTRPSVLIEPCGHLCLCDTCAITMARQQNELADNYRCPVCRALITSLRPVY
eukprot:TRINITY_DN7475_c0_g1_i1.p1 TRINITY_DN7475_c0_g1~~TRINITY_DN7475_c0_g1_i1.p1  ORF type:complete len:371 (+),score=37.91 TRINITY_DN7475_c0_g1_i1:119-1231(+)